MAPPLIGGSLTPRLSVSSSAVTVGLQLGSIFPHDLDSVDIGRRQTILRFAVAPSRRSALLRSRSATCGLDGAPVNLSSVQLHVGGASGASRTHSPVKHAGSHTCAAHTAAARRTAKATRARVARLVRAGMVRVRRAASRRAAAPRRGAP